MPDIEAIGINRTNLGRAVVYRTCCPETFGFEDQPVFFDLNLDIAPDKLVGNGIVRVIMNGIVLRCGCRRGQIVDERNQVFWFEIGYRHIE